MVNWRLVFMEENKKLNKKVQWNFFLKFQNSVAAKEDTGCPFRTAYLVHLFR
jgi:hypothetical protein